MSMIIAEIGTSHGGDIAKAKALVDAAFESGADAVKFQWVYANEILHPNTGFVNLPGGKIPLYERFKALECPSSFFNEIQDYARSKKLLFGCSPFGLKSLEELFALKPDFIKIASPELNHIPLLKRLSELRKSQNEAGLSPVPVILSSGVSKLSDIERAIEITGTTNVSLLHCITSYPAPEEEYNLRLIKTLSGIFGVKTGLSDHSLDPILVPVLSVLCGGSIIEKHITLSRKTDGLDDPVALEPEPFALMVHCVHQAEHALNRYGGERAKEVIINQLKESYPEERILAVLGTGIKGLAPAEKANYGRTNRSIHFMRDMLPGEVITEQDVAVLRTEKELTVGLSPEWLSEIIGLKLQTPTKSGSGVTLSHITQR